MGKLLRAVPHGVIGDGDLILLIGIRPRGILLHDLQRILPPDGAVGGCDHLDGKVQVSDLLQLFLQDRCKWVQDVSEVLHRLPVQKAEIRFIVEQLLHRIVLAEGVVGEEDVVAGEEGRHGIRPVEHAHLHKDQLLAVPDIQAVARFNHVEVPAMFSILSLNALYRVCRAVDGDIRDLLQKRRERTGVITLSMVCNDVIDVREIDLPLQIFDKLLPVRRPDGVDQNVLPLPDQIGILTAPVQNGIVIPVEGLQFPVKIANPCHISLYLLSHCHFLQSGACAPQCAISVSDVCRPCHCLCNSFCGSNAFLMYRL